MNESDAINDDSIDNYDNINVFGKAKIRKKGVVEYKITSGVFSKIAFFFGIIFLIMSVSVRSMIFTDKSSGFYSISVSSIPGSLLAISLILFFVSIVLYFFEYQFSKLEKICEEVENGEFFEE